jgi:hypothetical protein
MAALCGVMGQRISYLFFALVIIVLVTAAFGLAAWDYATEGRIAERTGGGATAVASIASIASPPTEPTNPPIYQPTNQPTNPPTPTHHPPPPLP